MRMMRVMQVFVRRHTILVQLSVLVFALWSSSLYNYLSQKSIFLQQLQTDSRGLLNSVQASISRFNGVKQTLSLQSLVKEISLKLDIFEFRYLDRHGTVVSSMFEEELGRQFRHEGFQRALQNPGSLGEFYMEERDYTQVMAISYPVLDGKELLGIIDLAVDVSALAFVDERLQQPLLQRMRLDVQNLLSAIAGSIISSNKVFATVEMSGFLASLVAATDSLVEVSLIDGSGVVLDSSETTNRGTIDAVVMTQHNGLIQRGNRPLYRVHGALPWDDGEAIQVAVYLDAQDYVRNERKLFYTALTTSLLGIVFALSIVYSIYRINLRRAHQENIRLERTVRERTAEIERISKTDKLTGLANRCALEEQLDMEFKRAKRYAHELSLVVVDLDHFKAVNDTHGHLAGDAVLCEIGQRLQRMLRETDYIGRFGGEEFVVILPETSLDHALQIAESLRKTVATEAVSVEGLTLLVTASLGVAALGPSHHGHKAIFAEADEGLYHAKKQGRNRVSYFDGQGPSTLQANG